MTKLYSNSDQRLFGTDGIRGTVNAGKVTALTAVNLAMAAGEYFYGKAGTKKSRVLIGKDTRLSGYMLEPALVAGFTSVGLDSITTGPLPTPAIAHLTRVLRCDLGVMISASHNPYEDNGLKLFGADGFKLNDEVENQIQLRMEKGPTLAKSELLGRARRMEDAIGRYSEFVKQILPKHQDLNGMKVVLDCANGASYKVGPEVLLELGAESIVIGVEPNGRNINLDCGAMFPNKMANTTKLEEADLGIALDGDADRVIFSDENGDIIHGDQIIALLAKEMKINNELSNDKVVGTLMSNLGLENFLLKDLGIKLKRSPVGDINVIEDMKKNKSFLGGEQSGHIILSDFSKTGDGILAALKITEIMSIIKKSSSSIFDLYDNLPQIKVNISYKKISEKTKKNIKDLNKKNRRYKKIRVLIRLSGTEPLIRLLVEGQDLKIVQQKAKNLELEIRNIIGQ